MIAKGMFEVTLTPASQDEGAIGRMIIDKQFQGDLQGASKGQMLSAMTKVQGSAGYVALELVTGTLHDRKGSFVLQHNGIMTRGEPQLTINVVPDSGTDELEGLSGILIIEISESKHSYEFDYMLERQR
ncbi:MAG TPA: DUF3224 domain-containing protein [Pyrinomonadaceae bacterium]